MPNTTEIFGDHNIVLQDIDSSTIHVTVQDGLPPEVKQTKAELKQRIEALRQEVQQKLATLPAAAPLVDIPSNLQQDVRSTLQALKVKQRCVLFIGPEIALDQPGVDLCLHERSFQAIAANDPELNYNQVEGFFEPSPLSSYELDLYEYYAEHFPRQNTIGKAILYHLAQLPFKLVLNFAPDETLHQLWDQYDRAHQFQSYELETRFPELSPDLDRPLLLNVLGSAETNGGRFVNTHKDFYQYIRDAELPSAVKQEIKHAAHLVFVGFDFSKWYTRLLMYLLDLSSSNGRRVHVNPVPSEEQVKQFLSSQFSLSSVEHEYLTFAQALSTRAHLEQVMVDGKKGYLAIDLLAFFYKKQLHKLQHLAARITDAREVVKLNDMRGELEVMTHKLKTHG